ncbi:MAG: ATP-binding cassette domain-containing protein [Nannocystaceae bacterium]|nr:ATP-binding cassette domain-containing protein [bacterium]
MSSIEIRALHVQGSAAGLRGVSLSVGPGERVAVVGPHQPRLSLLIRACAGFERVASGTVEVCGVDVGAADRRALLQLRRQLGYVSIAGGLLANMTLRDNLELAVRYRGTPHAVATKRVQSAIDAVGLQHMADHRTCFVPAEWVKCFAYVRALLLEPAVLLAEDPSAFLHPDGRRVVAALHDEAEARGIAVLIADDDVEFVTPLVHRVVELDALEAAS